MSEGIGWSSTRNFYKIETVDGEKRLKIDYAIIGLEVTREQLLLRRATTILWEEEKRLYALTDQQAIEELDALKAIQDKQFVRTVHTPQASSIS